MLLSLLASLSVAQAPIPAPDWKAWAPLLGTWEAEAKAPTDPKGGFTLGAELGGRVLVRHNRADYPATAKSPAFSHDDLLVMSQENGQTLAEYWDNEGHVIHYRASVEGQVFTMVSDAVAGQPRFRFTYTLKDPKTLAISFSIASPDAPQIFKPYIDAVAHKTK
jgi:hypothetical protein